MRFKNQPSALIRVAILILVMAPLTGAGAADRPPDLALLAAPPPEWQQTDAPTTVAGEALFTVINGGAEMYLRAGFRQAVFNVLQNADGLSINLEIYEMDNPAAARAIFAQKTGNSGLQAPFGQDARLASYYLNFWRGRYQITISGYASTPETLAAIRMVAATVDKRLQGD